MADSDAPVEQATAAPGEKRDVHRIDLTGWRLVWIDGRMYAERTR